VRQVGVTRRGKTPVLPPVHHSAAVDGGDDGLFPNPAPAPKAVNVPAPTAFEVPINARLARIAAPTVDVFRLPDPRSQWVGKLKRDHQVAVVSQWQGWFAIVMGDGSQAYVPQTHVELLPFQVKSVTLR
jgi:hypothetical protein